MDWGVSVPLWVFALFTTVFALVGVALALWCWHLVEQLEERDAYIKTLRRFYMAHVVTQKLPTVRPCRTRTRPIVRQGQKVRVS